MKIIKTLLFALAIVIFVACNDRRGSGYDYNTCENIARKIDDFYNLNEDDWSQMLNQLEAMVDIYTNKMDEFDGDSKELKKYEHSKEGREIRHYSLMFMECLYSYDDYLTRSQQQRWKAIKRKISMLSDASRNNYYDSYYGNYYDNYYDSYNDNYYDNTPSYEEPYYEEALSVPEAAVYEEPAAEAAEAVNAAYYEETPAVPEYAY